MNESNTTTVKLSKTSEHCFRSQFPPSAADPHEEPCTICGKLRNDPIHSGH